MKKRSILILLVFALCFCSCGQPSTRESRKSYTELQKENSALNANYKKAYKDYQNEKVLYEQLKQEFENYKEKMKPFETKKN